MIPEPEAAFLPQIFEVCGALILVNFERRNVQRLRFEPSAGLLARFEDSGIILFVAFLIFL